MTLAGVIAMVLVHDIDRALRFYRDILGLTVQEEQEDWVVFNEGIGLAVSPEPLPEVNLNLNSVMVTLLTPDVEAAYSELTSRGVAFVMAPARMGGASVAAFRDTENNVLQLMSAG